MSRMLTTVNVLLGVLIFGMIVLAFTFPFALSSYVPVGYSAGVGNLAPVEYFEDAAAEEKEEEKEPTFKGMTSAETELFEDLKQNKLSDADIKKLIVDGKLTDTLVNKFIKNLDIPALVKKTDTVKEDFADAVKPFACEDLYVGKPQPWTAEARWWDGTPQTGTGARSRGTC
jgi:hypothetical protein